MASNTHTPVVPPKAVTAFEFEARCADLVEEVRRIRRPLLITRRGKPVAQLSPYPCGRKVRGKKAIHARPPDHAWAWLSAPTGPSTENDHGTEGEKSTSSDAIQSQAPAPIPTLTPSD
jgi:prevent-host-death family protein